MPSARQGQNIQHHRQSHELEQSQDRRIIFIVSCFEKGEEQSQPKPQKYKIAFDKIEEADFENLVIKVQMKCFSRQSLEMGKSSYESQSSCLQRIFFKYVDIEDGDLTTIRTEEEFKVMLNQCVSYGDGSRIHLQVFQDSQLSYRSNTSSFIAPQITKFPTTPESCQAPKFQSPILTQGEPETKNIEFAKPHQESPREKAKKQVGQMMTLLKYHVFCLTGNE